MKVVIFCGGYGMRIRSDANSVPKPMACIGDRPVLWHVMRYYAHFGHKDFILCLGYGAAAVKKYFLEYDETISNDFVLSGGGEQVDLLSTDISDWRITFVDTGLNSPIGERLRRVQQHLGDEEVFHANYGDVLTDAPLDRMADQFLASGATASLLAVPPQASFHVVSFGREGWVSDIAPASELPLRENGGYFLLRQEVFDVLGEDEDLVTDVFPRLAGRRELLAIPHDGFWAPMDTLKERTYLEELHQSGRSPWEVWARPARVPLPRPPVPVLVPDLAVAAPPIPPAYGGLR